jgi:hypothetical protein
MEEANRRIPGRKAPADQPRMERAPLSSRGGRGRGTRGPQLIGVGTSVLARLCLRAGPDQGGARAVFGCARRTDPRVRHYDCSTRLDTLRRYRLDKTALIATVERLLSRVRRERRTTERRDGRPASGSAVFADYRLAALNPETGAAPTDRFDEQATSRPAFALAC